MTRNIATSDIVDRDRLLAFLRERKQGILLTTRTNGRPQGSPVTYGVDGAGRIVVSSYPERAKSRNAAARPVASFIALSDDFGGAWVQVDGTTEVIGGEEAIEPLVEYFRVISGEHPDWDEYREAMRKQGKVLIRITIESWGPIATGGFPARLADD